MSNLDDAIGLLEQATNRLNEAHGLIIREAFRTADNGSSYVLNRSDIELTQARIRDVIARLKVKANTPAPPTI